jgi:hypothetical protein
MPRMYRINMLNISIGYSFIAESLLYNYADYWALCRILGNNIEMFVIVLYYKSINF